MGVKPTSLRCSLLNRSPLYVQLVSGVWITLNCKGGWEICFLDASLGRLNL